MERKKKTLTLNEIFCGMPFLREYFKGQDALIKKFGTKATPAVEEWKEKKKALLKTAKELRITDLEIIYYINALDVVRSGRILLALKNLYAAQCELKNSLSVEEKYRDILDGATD